MNIILESYRAGLFQRKHWLPNLIAGVIVGIVALPLAMAFAIASGVKPEQGLYTAIVAGIVVSIFGGSRLQIAGPTGAFIVILSGITSKYGIDGLQIATLLAGIILCLFGIARLGAVIKFIPDPVIVGFTAGIAIVIWVGQSGYFLGLPQVTGSHFHEKLWHLIQVLPQFDINTTCVGLASLFILIYVNKIPGFKRIPAPLVVLILTTALQSYFHFTGIATIGSLFGDIPQRLPQPHWPELSIDRVLELIGPAFTIAMLGAIESLLSAVVADGMSGTRHHSNRELIGQGLANIVAPLFGGFAATGAIARTATSIRNGGTSPLAGIVHALTLVLIIIFLAPLATNIPLSALAAILFIVAWNMSEVHHVIKMIKRAPISDVTVLFVTFMLTIFADLVVAVNIGVILAILHFLLKMAESVDVKQETAAELFSEYFKAEESTLPADVLVYSVDGPFFFGAIETFERALQSTHTDPRVLVIRLRWVPFIDITGINALEEVILDLHQRNVRVILIGANPVVKNKLKKAGILNLLGPKNVFNTFSEALLTQEFVA
jgi:SulP family sulfate permease